MTSKLAAIHVALGGGGLGGWIVHIIIWHEIWRLIRFVWHVHTFGPFLVFLIIAVIIGALVWRRQRGSWGARRGNRGFSGSGTGAGPRDW